MGIHSSSKRLLEAGRSSCFYHKKGKFPFSSAHLQKISHNTLTMMYPAGAKIPKATKLPDGCYKLKMPLMKQQFDPHAIARVLFKMGLGFVAIGKGQEEALHPR